MREAIYIRVNGPSLNKNIGKYHLPHIWDEVLNNITELKLKINIKTQWLLNLPHWLQHLANPFHPSGYNICQVVITSATSHISGYSISHQLHTTSAKKNLSGNNISHITHQWHSISHYGNNISHQKWINYIPLSIFAITSATNFNLKQKRAITSAHNMAITSAIIIKYWMIIFLDKHFPIQINILES